MISVKGNLTGKLNTTYTKIYPELENLTVTPSEEQQKFIHEDRYGYDKVVVNPIPDKYIIPSGSLDITENGNYNVKEKEFANVNVPTKTFGTKTITTNGTYNATDDNLDGYSEVEVATSGVDINEYIKPETINEYTATVGCWHTFIKKIPKLNLNITKTCYNMFYNCKAQEIDVSEFNTSNVTNMNGMFSYCSSLTSLDLSSFDTSKITNMSYLFDSCTRLKNLNISNFDFTKVTTYTNMFTRVPNDCYMLVKDATAKDWITSKFTNLTNVHYVGEIE